MTQITDTFISKVLFDLETIAKYTSSDIIDTISSEYINLENDSIRRSLDRSLNGDSRYRALNRMDDRIISAYEYAERLLESRYLLLYQSGNWSLTIDNVKLYEERMSLLKTICGKLEKAAPGIVEFRKKYSTKNDSSVVAQCDALIKKTGKIVRTLKIRLSELDSEKESYEAQRELQYE